MKSIAVSAVLSIAALSSCSLAAVSMDIAKNTAPGVKMSKRMLAKRGDFTASLKNQINYIGNGNYIISVSVGTPPQSIQLAVDTGSSDVWVLASSADVCSGNSNSGDGASTGCTTPFNYQDSSTFKVTEAGGFDITYVDQTGASGDYFTDVLSFGNSETLKAQTMGIAYNSTLSPGLLGIGYDTNEAAEFEYSSLIDSLVSQGLINTKAYSMYLNDLGASTGSLLFGGVDSDKYRGNLVSLPIIPTETQTGESVYNAFTVAMVSLAVAPSPGNSTLISTSSLDIPVVLDSGTTLAYIPDSLFQALLDELKGEFDEQTNFGYVDCSIRDNNPDYTFNFGFGTEKSTIIQVPAAEMILDLASVGIQGQPAVSVQNPCALGFLSQDEPPYTLGDTFLRSAYLVYDLKNNLVAIGQTNFESTSSNVIDIAADATTIPMVSGVATGIVTEPTGSSSSSSSSSGSGSSSNANPSKSGSPAAVLKPLDLGPLAVIGISTVFAALGGGWFFA